MFSSFDIRRNAPDLVRLFRVVRYEVSALKSDLAGRLSLRQRARLSQLRKQRGLMLNIGCGGHRVDGWVHVDGDSQAEVRVDLRRALPFADGSVCLIHSEHFLDHLDYPTGAARFLRECRRMLQRDGRLRIVVHDLKVLARKYLEGDRDFFVQAGAASSNVGVSLNHLLRFNDFHRFMFDFDSLAEVLGQAGFTHMEQSSFRKSSIPELNIDRDLPDRAIQSLYVEARP